MNRMRLRPPLRAYVGLRLIHPPAWTDIPSVDLTLSLYFFALRIGVHAYDFIADRFVNLIEIQWRPSAWTLWVEEGGALFRYVRRSQFGRTLYSKDLTGRNSPR